MVTDGAEINDVRVEKSLAFLYGLATLLSLASAGCIAIAWQYWQLTLDVCINVDCGCVLYGVNTFRTFMGGDGKICHFAVYSLIPVTVVGFCMCCFHGYRSCFTRNLDRPDALRRRRNSNSWVVVVQPKPRSKVKHWLPLGFGTSVLCCLALSHSVVITDGYYKSCDEYRKNLVQLLGSRGREVEVIHNRLSCGAILDYMDYLQPDENNHRRGDEINTSLALQFSIVTTWFNFFAWFAIVIINFVMARQRMRARNENIFFC